MEARYPGAGIGNEISRLGLAGISRVGEIYRVNYFHINALYRHISPMCKGGATKDNWVSN